MKTLFRHSSDESIAQTWQQAALNLKWESSLSYHEGIWYTFAKAPANAQSHDWDIKFKSLQ